MDWAVPTYCILTLLPYTLNPTYTDIVTDSPPLSPAAASVLSSALAKMCSST